MLAIVGQMKWRKKHEKRVGFWQVRGFIRFPHGGNIIYPLGMVTGVYDANWNLIFPRILNCAMPKTEICIGISYSLANSYRPCQMKLKGDIKGRQNKGNKLIYILNTIYLIYLTIMTPLSCYVHISFIHCPSCTNFDLC